MTVCLGVDIGGTKIAASAVDPDGTIRARARRRSPAQDADRIALVVADLVGQLVQETVATGEEVVAVGVACAGFIARSDQRVVFAPNLAWRDEPVRERLESLTGLPVTVENDANAAAWGEHRFGAGRGTDDLVLITLGTGVGGGIVLDGRLVRGAHGFGAEVGHLRVVPQGHRCGCGNRGCWEMYASGTALVREARALVAQGGAHAAALTQLCGGDPDALTGVMVTAAARGGDPAATEVLDGIGRWTGEGLASLAAVLDPGLIIVGGGVSQAGDLVLAPARDAFARHLTGRGHRPTPPVVAAGLGNDAGMVGVADLARVAQPGQQPR